MRQDDFDPFNGDEKAKEKARQDQIYMNQKASRMESLEELLGIKDEYFEEALNDKPFCERSQNILNAKFVLCSGCKEMVEVNCNCPMCGVYNEN